MHFALQRTCSNTQKVTDWENHSLSSKSLEENSFRASSNVCEASSLAWRNSDHQCAIVTLFPLEPYGHWRIPAVPFQCPDHTIHLGSESQVKMDGLHLVSPSLVGSVRVDQQKARKGPTSERKSSIQSYTARRFSGSNFQYQSRNKGVPNKASRWNALPGNSSCQASFNSSGSSVVIPNGLNATNSCDAHIAISKEDKAVKRNPKKKARKKGYRSKKLSCDTGSTDLECVRRSSTSETGISKNTDYVIAPLPYASRLTVSSPESIGKCGDSGGNSSGNISSSEMPKTCTTYFDEGDVLETSFIGENSSSNAENGVQTDFPEFSIFSGLQDTHSKPSCSNGPCTSIYSEANDSSALDSISVCSSSVKSINSGYRIKLSTKDTGGTSLSEAPGFIARNGCFSLPNLLNGVEDSYCQIEGTTSSDMARRGKHIKNVPRNSSIPRLSSSGKFCGRSGKENNHSIWQKVQRNDTDECSSGLRKVNSGNSQTGAGLKEVPLRKKKCNSDQPSTISTSEERDQSKVRASRKLRRKTSAGSKQEPTYYSRKGPYATKASSNVCRNSNVQQSEVLDMSSNSVSGSCSEISCRTIGFLNNRVESITTEPVHIVEGRPDEFEPLEHVCATLSSLNGQTAKRESSSLLGFFNSPNQAELPEDRSTEYLNPLGGEGTKLTKDVSPLEHSKQEQSCEFTLQKWIPVGKKAYEFSRSAHSNGLQLANLDRSVGEIYPSQNTVREMASDPDTSSSINASIMCSVQGSRDHDGLHSEDDVQSKKHLSQSTCTPKKSSVNQVGAKCFSHDPKDQNHSAVENDSNKLAHAINDAYRAQLVSEAVQMATGSPIAEFEKLLYSASPVLSPSDSIFSCQICLPDEIVGASLCRHEIPNISLGSLWQWYEKHGTYGLEVRAKESDNSKRLGIDRVAFRAYFVPYLSAVQLFRKCKSHSHDSSRAAGGQAMEEACKLDERPLNSSNVGCLPIFSVLFPQPRMGDTSSLSPRNSACCSEMSSLSSEGNETTQSDDSASSNDSELLFEYFEVEQPQKRRPLFEKIKELVRGDGPSQCRAYGDPTNLDSVALNDLHHTSWYSVAWYPIYRIPDDNFRAAFLTYHSLGHLVRRSVTSDSFGVSACVVSPVVGLQSYNAQGECWFQLRQSALSQTRELPKSNTSQILKDRLRTLEQTASLMARAVVTKGNLTSVNRQPDYEFFLSRRRW